MPRPISLSLPLSLRALPAALCVALVGLAAGAAGAAVHPLAGNARFGLGPSLQRPGITTSIGSGPTGIVAAVSSATVQVTPVSGQPARLVLKPSQLTAPANPATLPLYLLNPFVFQIYTARSVQFPASTVSFEASGRTGAATFTYCPGHGTITTGGCPFDPLLRGALMRYTRTAAQFGGPGLGSFQGGVEYGWVVASPAPCSGPACQVIFMQDASPAVFGGAFGVTGMATHPAPSPGRFIASVTAGGLVTNLLTPQGAGIGNNMQQFAGPWTTGRVTVSIPSTTPPRLAVFSGADTRSPAGQGTINLVSGGVVSRTGGSAGPSIAKGFLNLTVLPEPTAWTGLTAGALALLGLARWRRAGRPAVQAE